MIKPEACQPAKGGDPSGILIFLIAQWNQPPLLCHKTRGTVLRVLF
ncbi:MAG: hypothetical protein KA004_02330 [Verrucomicrobiales bacterium]|nr:hypothetical protein [Verrucomicrobiales bacterium]